jgi:AraC family transcriptional regulator of arabinose operon
MVDPRVLVSEIDPLSRRLTLTNCVAQTLRQDSGSQVGPRLQQQIQMVLVHVGHMTVSIAGRRSYDVSAGQMCILLPGHMETIRFPADAATSQTVIRGDADRLTDEMRAWLEALRPTRNLSAALTYLSREAVATVQTRLTANGALVDALGTALLWRFIAEFQNYPAALPERIEEARLFIHQHLEDDIGLTEIAGAAHVSPAHLIRLFREHIGTTPTKYLWDRRVTLGMELLTSTGMPVSIVALRSGFKTSFHFARKIKEASGLSPTQLRQISWSTSEARSSNGVRR